MLRLAGFAFAAVLVALVVLSLGPTRDPDPIDRRVQLTDARVDLYPAADPEAVWHFEAPEVTFDPDVGETTLRSVQEGERRVGDEVDFTLRSERLVIDRNDDLRTESMSVHLVEDDLDAIMTGRGGRGVFVDQAAGRFEVPHMELTGETFGESTYQDMRVSFDFTDFEAGGPGTVGYSQLLLEERTEDTP